MEYFDFQEWEDHVIEIAKDALSETNAKVFPFPNATVEIGGTDKAFRIAGGNQGSVCVFIMYARNTDNGNRALGDRTIRLQMIVIGLSTRDEPTRTGIYTICSLLAKAFHRREDDEGFAYYVEDVSFARELKNMFAWGIQIRMMRIF